MGKRIRILTSSDVHGVLFPYEYAKGRGRNWGLAKLSGLIRSLRGPDTILIDNGDTLEGSPLSFYHYAKCPPLESPMTAAMAMMRYDFVNLGNHDFDYGPEALFKHLENSGARCLCVNISYRGDPLGSYAVRRICGKKLAFFAVCTQYVRNWEPEDKLEGFVLRDAFESARETAEKIRETEDPDYLICVYHGGFEKDPVTGEILSETDENEGFRMLTSIPEIDILITGHQHRKYCGVFRRAEGAGTAGAGPGACPEGTQGEDSAGPVDKASGIIYTQTRDNGVELSCIEIDAETGMICARILPADAEPDQELLLAAEGEEKDCQNWLDRPLGRSETDLRVIDEFDGRLHKSQLITFLNRVQMEISGAQLAGSALFRGACGFGKEITMRDLVSTYSFPNTLAVKLVSGKVLKAYLEKCAEFWALNGDRIVVSERFEKPVPMYFNYDMVDGVSYTIDVSRPVGSRIVRLETAAAAEQKDSGSAGFGTAQNGSGNGTVQQGCTVTDDMEFTLAVNNYRAAGGGGFDMLRDAPTIREIPMSMVDLLAEYIMKHKRIRFEPVENIIVTAHTA